MTRYYIDITIKGGIDNRNFNMSLIYGIIHGLMRNSEISDVGVAFPYYTIESDSQFTSLGKVLRLVSINRENLIYLTRSNAIDIKAEVDLIGISGIKEVPENTLECLYKRDRISEKMFRRGEKNTLNYPYAKFLNKNFMLKIKQEIVDTAKLGSYNTYGLSVKNSTVPHF